MSDLALIGTNYRTSDIARRECFSVQEQDLAAFYGKLVLCGISEAVYLSTCNRAELYISADDPADAAQKALFFIRQTVPDMADGELYVKYSRDAVEHLFSVTSSLDSMVLGEAEIANQVKRCYASATSLGMTGSLTHRLFHAAFRCSKRVRTETAIARNPVSVATIVGELAKKHFPDLASCNVLLIGAGEMGELVLKTLDKCGVQSVTVANRSVEKAGAIAAGLSVPVNTLQIGRVASSGSGADIIVCSIASDCYIITPEILNSFNRSVFKKRVIVDIGVPRNVDPDCEKADGVSLYNIDSLKETAEENRRAREEEALKGRMIVNDCSDEFIDWQREQEVIPAIASVSQKVDAIRKEQLAKFRSTSLKHLSDEDFDSVAELTEQIMVKIMHNPIQNMKRHHREMRGTSDAGRDSAEFFKRLFLK